MMRPRPINSKYNTSKTPLPNKPNSSENTAKIKSVVRSGINSKCDWDAKSDSFSQFHRNLLEEDHGTFENPLDYYYEYHSYKHQFFGIQFSIVLDMIGSMLNGQFEIWSNSVLNHYRSS